LAITFCSGPYPRPGMICQPTCRALDPTKDSVRVDTSAIERDLEEQQQRLADDEHLRQQEEARLQAREEAAQAAIRFEQELAVERQMERQLQEEEAERQRMQDQRLREERRRQEARAKCVEQRLIAERVQLEDDVRHRQERARREALDVFCRHHGFTDIHAPRRNGCSLWTASTTYPLHHAAELGNYHIVEMLLKEGADPDQKNSSGKTAAQIARKKNRNGSHDAVQKVLSGAVVRPCTGGA